MRIAQGRIVPLGYGKYVRSERIVAMEPIEEGRGPGRRIVRDQSGWDLDGLERKIRGALGLDAG